MDLPVVAAVTLLAVVVALALSRHTPTAPGPAAGRDPTYSALLCAFGLVVLAASAEALLRGAAGPPAGVWTGRALVAAGAGLTLWARRALGPSYAPTALHPDPAAPHVRAGPYRWLRHPQYAGNTLSVVGLLLALDARWAWLALGPFLAALAWRVRVEARGLRARFGETW